MIDIHAHILNCGDDGAQTKEDTLKMCAAFVKDGVTQVFATPHFMRGSLEIPPEKIINLTAEYNQTLKDKALPLKIMPGMEIEICHDLLDLWVEGKILSLNDQGKYMLIELPFHSYPNFTKEIFYELRIRGITPILAHPERNQVLLEEPEIIRDLVENGALMQMNAGSLLGYFGSQVKKRGISLIRENLVHFVAGDAHRSKGHRGPCLQLAGPILEKLIGREKANILLKENPGAVIKGSRIIKFTPQRPVKGFMGLVQKIFK